MNVFDEKNDIYDDDLPLTASCKTIPERAVEFSKLKRVVTTRQISPLVTYRFEHLENDEARKLWQRTKERCEEVLRTPVWRSIKRSEDDYRWLACLRKFVGDEEVALVYFSFGVCYTGNVWVHRIAAFYEYEDDMKYTGKVFGHTVTNKFINKRFVSWEMIEKYLEDYLHKKENKMFSERER